MLQIFFILLHVFGRCRETMTGETSREPPPPPPPPRPAVFEPVYTHYGHTVAAEEEDRQADDTQEMFSFLSFFLCFSFFNKTPQNKQNILLPWVVG